MSESKHTEGPLRIEERFCGYDIIDKGGRVVAKVDNLMNTAILDEEAQANARLIAAAPDMAEALQAVYEAGQWWSDNTDFPLKALSGFMTAAFHARGILREACLEPI